jgi:hypothetical protein
MAIDSLKWKKLLAKIYRHTKRVKYLLCCIFHMFSAKYLIDKTMHFNSFFMIKIFFTLLLKTYLKFFNLYNIFISQQSNAQVVYIYK